MALFGLSSGVIWGIPVLRATDAMPRDGRNRTPFGPIASRRRYANIRALQGDRGGCDVGSGLDTARGSGRVSIVVGLVRSAEADARLRLLQEPGRADLSDQ